jgi:Ras-related protein Rab-11A
LTGSYYRGAMGALVVYDITNRQSFLELNRWLREINSQVDTDCVILVVGNKCDLENRRDVSTEEAAKFAEKYDLSFLETSALNRTNVDAAFTTLIQQIYKRQHQKNIVTSENTTEENEKLLSNTPPEPKIAINPDTIRLTDTAVDGDLKTPKDGCSC